MRFFLAVLLSGLFSSYLPASLIEEESKQESVKMTVTSRDSQKEYVQKAKNFFVKEIGEFYLEDFLNFKGGLIRASDAFGCFESIFSKPKDEKAQILLSRSGKLAVKEISQEGSVPELIIKRYDKEDPLNIQVRMIDLFLEERREKAESFFKELDQELKVNDNR